MDKKLFRLEIFGFVFVSVIGTLNHFLYISLNKNIIVGLFCPVNESVFEHLKMIFFPFLIYSIIEYFILKMPKNFFFAKFTACLFGELFIISFFYTYSGIIGKNTLTMDILTFLLGVIFSFFISSMIIKNNNKNNLFLNNISIICFIFNAVLFFLFTFHPPFLPLFKDITTGIYGI